MKSLMQGGYSTEWVRMNMARKVIRASCLLFGTECQPTQQCVFVECIAVVFAQ